MGWLRRFRETVGLTGRRDLEVDEELEFHLDQRAAEYMQAGMSPPEARRLALRRFGSLARTRDDVRDVNTLRSLDSIRRDVHHACRALVRDPGFAATVVATLALGIGANAAMFALTNAVLFKPLFARDPEQLVSVLAAEPNQSPGSIKTAMVDLIREERVLEGLCGFLPLSVTVDLHGSVAPIQTHPMTGDCFETLGIRAAIGRLFTLDDARTGTAHVAVLTYDTWMRDYGGSPSALNENINVDGVKYAIVGVTERGFTGLRQGFPARLFIPFGNFAGGLAAYFPPPDLLSMSLVARLRSTAGVDQTLAALRARWPHWAEQSVSSRLTPQQRDWYLKSTPHLESATTGPDTTLRSRYQTPLLALLGISTVVLLVTCINGANLVLARATARQREAAVRTALGASRAQLLRESAAESVLLLLAGAAGALVVARGINHTLLALLQRDSPDFALDVAADARVFGFTLIVSALALALFAAVPGWQTSRVDASVLVASSTRVSGGHRRLRQLAISIQIALTMLLLGTGAAFIQVLQDLRAADLGISLERVIGAQLSALPGGYGGGFNSATYYRTLVETLEREPEIEAAALSRDALFMNRSWIASVGIAGGEAAIDIPQSFVSDRFFATLRIPLLAGVPFARFVTPQSTRAAILSESAARSLFGDANAVGRHIRVGSAAIHQRVEVIGIAKDAALRGPQQRDTRIVYLNFWQFAASVQTYPTLLVKLRPARRFGIERLQQLVSESGREYVSQSRTLAEQRDAALSNEALLATLTGAFAVLGLSLAAVGLYGLLAFLVAERTSEIGIRMALGANRRRITVLVLRDTLVIMMLGGIVGGVSAIAVNQWIAAALYGDASIALAPIAVAGLVMGLVAAGAVYMPTLRATGLNPIRALRDE